MLDELRERLTRPHTVAGLCAAILPDGQLRWTLCVLQRKNNLVSVLTQAPDLATVEDVLDRLGDASTPVALVITGRGLLLRQLPTDRGSATTTDQEWVTSLLPGASPADFYVQYLAGELGAHVALIRKAAAEQLLTQAQLRALLVIDLSLGPMRLQTLAPFMSLASGNSVLSVSGYDITFSQQGLASAVPSTVDDQDTDPVQLGAEELPAVMTLPYAAALHLLLGLPGNEVGADQVRLNYQEWQHRKIFPVGLWAVLLTLLVVLLANFLAFSYLSSQSQQLSAAASTDQVALRRLTQLRSVTGEQQAFLKSAGWLQATQASMYADQLALSLPPRLTLLTLDIYPYNARSSSMQQQVVFVPGILLIKGKCEDAQALDTWLQRLNRLPWVKAVRDQNFNYDYAGRSGTFTFTIHLAEQPRR
ncbi:hypothetical protein [Hymenobacter lucidus]|uniref:General secretion pathway protein GspL n=1 Tax=Hymenobacter lucidus TaxID=2880930 RepID=A0ABS8AZC4_9BACT|nr:hypothetical protein [Hymenobacter lucidus]MCB2411157.1 hypothetical protein [Hymenobacter lucidus]